MVIELYYSSKVFNFPFSLTESLRSFVLNFYGPVHLKKEDFSAIMDLMKFDKKNVSGKVNFVLLDTIENCKLDIQLSPELIEEGLLYYKHGNA